MEMDNQQTLQGEVTALRAGARGTKAVTKKSYKWLKSAVSTISSFIGISGVQLVATTLVVVIIFGAIAAAIKNLSLDRNYFRVSLTPEGKEIISLFKVYTNDLYPINYDGMETDEARTDEYRFGTAWKNNKLHKNANVHDDDDERDKYKAIMDFIEKNEYEFFLCGLWKTLMWNTINYYCDYGTYPNRDGDTETERLNYDRLFEVFVPDYNDAEDSIYQSLVHRDYYEHWYYFVMRFYVRFQDRTKNRIFGFQVDDEDKAEEYFDEDMIVSDPYMVKELFKACLDAFTDEHGNINVPTIEELNKEILDKTPEVSEIEIDTTEKATTPAVRTKLSPDITVDQYAHALVNKTDNNFIRALKHRYGFFSKNFGTATLDSLKEHDSTLFHIARQSYYHFKDLDRDERQELMETFDVDAIVGNYIREQMEQKSLAFLIYSSQASGTAANVLALAQNEIGNRGQKYCDEINGGEYTQWCSIYVKWLLKNGAGIDVDADYGWSAGVGYWCDALKEKGLFHVRDDPNDKYTPKPGDIVIFTWGPRDDGNGPSRDHVGIVVGVEGDVVITNEGNTSDPVTGAGSVVAEHRNGEEAGRPLSSIYGYGEVTYRNIETITPDGGNYTPNKISPNEAQQKAYKYFTSKGLNKAATCAIMASIMIECSFDADTYFAGYVPDALGAPGNSGGICMWYDDNCDRFKRDCPAWYYSFDAQLEYLYQTLLNNGQGSPNTKYYYYCTGCLSKLKSAPNTLEGAKQAAIDFHDYYERSAFPGSERTGWAETFWNSFK